jgi:hypothetical protein
VKGGIDKDVALKIVMGDREKEVSFRELCLSNNLSQEALVSLLVKKKLIEPKELLEEIRRVKEERYRSQSDE